MSKVLINDEYLHDIANSIRKMRRTNNLITTDSMAGEIEQINIGYDPNEKWQRPLDWPDYSQIDISTNIIDKNAVTSGYINSSGGITNTTGWFYTDYIPVEENTEYIASSISRGGSGTYYALYDINKTLTRTVLIVANENPMFITQANERFVRFSLRNIQNEMATAQLQKGTMITEYVPSFEGMYFTYDSTAPDAWCGFTATASGGYVVERGQIINGQFIIDKTTNVASAENYIEMIPYTTSGYVVYRITAKTQGAAITRIGHVSLTAAISGGSTTIYQVQPLLERYGRLPRATTLYQWTNYSVVSDTILDMGEMTTLENCWYGDFLIENIDLTGFASKPTSLASAFRTCVNLKWLTPSNKLVTSACTSMNYTFYYCFLLKVIDTNGWDTSKVTNFSYAFSFCCSVYVLDISNIDTSSATTFSYMFEYTYKLNKMDVSGFDTSNVTSFAYMFRGNNRVEELDVSNFSTGKATNMAYMFQGCRVLKELDVSSFNTEKVTNMSYMFNSCSSLETLDLTNFDVSKVTDVSYMFTNCYGLKSLNLSGWHLSATKTMREFLDCCYSLVDLNTTGMTVANTLSASNCFTNAFYYLYKVYKIDLSGFDFSGLPGVNTSTFRYAYSVCEIKMSETFVAIGATYFDSCRSLQSLVLPSPTVVSLANTNAFGSTPATKKIYVPDELVEDYRVATNWKNITCTFVPLSEYQG